MNRLFRYCFLAISLFVFQGMKGQIDSLLELSRHAKKDTTGILVFYELSKQYLKMSRHDEAFAAVQRAYTMSKEIGYVKGEAISLQMLGNYYTSIDKDSVAIGFYRQSLQIATDIKLSRLVAANLSQMASINSDKGRYLESLSMFKKALAIFTSEKDSVHITSTFVNLANLYIKMEDSEKALKTLEQAAKTARTIKTNEYVPYISLTIGNILMDQGYKNEAIGYFNECAAYGREHSNPYLEAVAISNIASLEEDFDKSLRLHLQSMDAFVKLNSKSQTARVTLNIGELYAKHGDVKKALEQFTEAAKLLKEIEDNYGVCIALRNIAISYLRLGETGKAFDYAEQSLTKAKELKLLKHQLDAYAVLHKIYLKKGQLKEALSALEMQMALKDSLNSEKNSRALSAFKTRIDLEKQEEQLKVKAEIERQKVLAKLEQERVLQKARQTRQVLISVFIGIILLLAIAFSFSLWKRFRVIEAQKKLIEQQKDLVEEKQKEILDSIRYARRIQSALMTPEKYIDKSLRRLNNED